jgi:hypothetical protein
MKPTTYFTRLSAALLLAFIVTPLAYVGILVANLVHISSGSNWAVVRIIAIVFGMLLLVGPIYILDVFRINRYRVNRRHIIRLICTCDPYFGKRLLVMLGKKHMLPNYMIELSFRNLFRWQLIILVSLMAFGIGLAEAASHLY